jgi:predicted amidohydrolase YtcJ
MVALSRNILSTPAEELLNTSVDLTMVDGEIVYRQPTL